MIESLHISNYALIDSVDVQFKPGFNIITGETGAGKSIILGALSLLLGARADSRAARHPEKKSVIEAVFSTAGIAAVEKFCSENDIDHDPERCILRREITPNGRSRAFVNDTPVPLSRLEALSIHLVDIHSQNSNLLLTQPAFQLEIVDTLAHNEARLEEYTLRYNRFRHALKRLRDTRAEIERTRDDEDFTRYQLSQINAIAPIRGELEELEHEREVIADAANIKSKLTALLDAISEASGSAIDRVTQAELICTDLNSVFNGEEKELAERLNSMRVELRDIADTVAAANRTLDADPSQLEATDERISVLRAALRRHHLENVDQLIELRNELLQRLQRLDDSDTIIAELEKEARRARSLARETAREISEARKAAAITLSKEIIDRAVPLGMKNLQCEIRVEPTDMGPYGTDEVTFLFAFNKNQPLMPVGQTASGGEISRIMLTIKAIVAGKMQLPSMIFDEVDTGVGGDVANRMGELMLRMSQNIQVIAITHLPQIAAKGNTQFKVYKQDDDTSTHTHITELSNEQRLHELALMLSGDPNDKAALKAAESLINNPV